MPRLPRFLLDRVDDVGAGLFIVLELEETALLRFEEKFIEGAEPVRALIKAGVLAFDGLFHEGTAN